MNRGFREHVTRVGFNLTLTHRQIAALEFHALAIRNHRKPWAAPYGAASSQLADRGLLEETPYGVMHRRPSKAGWLVFELLGEAGLLQGAESELDLEGAT